MFTVGVVQNMLKRTISFFRRPIRLATIVRNARQNVAYDVCWMSSNVAGGPTMHDTLVNRQLFLTTPFVRSAHAEITSVSVVDEGRNVEIIWNDGSQSRYLSMWLRQACHCPSCRSSPNSSIVDFASIDVEAKITWAQKEGDTLLKVKWSDDEDHIGILPAPYIRHYSYSVDNLTQISAQQEMVFTKEANIPQILYDDVMKTENGLYEWLNILGNHGICLIKNVPSRDLEVKRVAERIARVQATIYGDTFEIRGIKRPINAAFSSIKLNLHMDQPQYESPPGLQLLHCLKFDDAVVGGESVFVDMFHVAETMREKHPAEFQDLVRIPATFEKIHYYRAEPVHMTYSRPHIKVNHQDKIIGVTWHPGLIGPPQVKEEDVDLYYKAYSIMARLVNTFSLQYRCRLQEGDLISINNRRVAHGREAFDPNEGSRHLQGTYVQIDEFKSRLQFYSNTKGDGKLATRVGNMDWQ